MPPWTLMVEMTGDEMVGEVKEEAVAGFCATVAESQKSGDRRLEYGL